MNTVFAVKKPTDKRLFGSFYDKEKAIEHGVLLARGKAAVERAHLTPPTPEQISLVWKSLESVGWKIVVRK